MVGRSVFGVTAVDLVAGESRVVAEVLPIREAVMAGVVGGSEPGHTDPIPRCEPVDEVAGADHAAYYLVTGDQRELRVGEFPVYHVQIGPAHRTSMDS